MARPTKKTKALINRFCERIAGGETVAKVCSDPRFPHKTTLFRWLRADKYFQDQYARALAFRSDVQFDEILEIIDDPKLAGRGKAAVSQAREQVAARQWMMGKMRPRVYGDRVTVKFDFTEVPDEELDEFLARFGGQPGDGPAGQRGKGAKAPARKAARGQKAG